MTSESDQCTGCFKNMLRPIRPGPTFTYSFLLGYVAVYSFGRLARWTVDANDGHCWVASSLNVGCVHWVVKENVWGR